jgi:hypothetical protein
VIASGPGDGRFTTSSGGCPLDTGEILASNAIDPTWNF